jgi:formylglycine-generating enzyme required for sulfatase activity
VLPPVDTLADGAAPCGIVHAAGTVAEWTSSTLADFVSADSDTDTFVFGGTGERAAAADAIGVVAGGSWRDPADEISPRRVRFMPPRFVRPTVGFRIATSVAPSGDDDEG